MKTQPARMHTPFALAAVLIHAGSAAAQTARFEASSSLPFVEYRPTAETAQTLRDELLFQRAPQTDAWQRPIPVDGGRFFGDVGLPGRDAGKGYFSVLRPYGPTEAAIDKRWKPGDIERTS